MRNLDVGTPAKAAAVAIEEMIRHNSVETGVLIAQDGTTVIKRRGSVDRVPFSHLELQRSTGMTFTHNHPSGFGLSLEDLRLGALYEMAEVRVVTAKARYGVSLLRLRHLTPLTQSFANEEVGAKVAVTDDVRRGVVNPRDFGVTVRHRTLERLAVRLGFDYWRHEQ